MLGTHASVSLSSERGAIRQLLTQEVCLTTCVLVFVRPESQTFSESTEICGSKNPLSELFLLLARWQRIPTSEFFCGGHMR